MGTARYQFLVLVRKPGRVLKYSPNTQTINGQDDGEREIKGIEKNEMKSPPSQSTKSVHLLPRPCRLESDRCRV